MDWAARVDLSKLTIGEYRAMMEPGRSDEADDAVLAKVVGLSVEELQGLSVLEYKRLLRAFLLKVKEPLSSPN
jgi:hypothetical protein